MKFLRFTTFAIAILGMVGLFSCGDDDTPPTLTNAQKIEGTWVITATPKVGRAEKGNTSFDTNTRCNC